MYQRVNESTGITFMNTLYRDEEFGMAVVLTYALTRHATETMTFAKNITAETLIYEVEASGELKDRKPAKAYGSIVEHDIAIREFWSDKKSERDLQPVS